MTPCSRVLARSAVMTALLSGTSLAFAVPGASSVLITSFSTTTSVGTLTWSDPFQSFLANALNAGGLLGADSDAFDADDYAIAIAGATTSAASAAVSTTTPQTFWATANTVNSVGPATNLPNQAEASAGQSGSFTLSQAGSVTFNVGWRLDVASPGGNPLTDYSAALLAFNAADADNGSGGTSSTALQSFAQGTGMASRIGTFSLTVDLSSGETGFYTLQGTALAFSTASMVPEPAGWLLLTGGLTGIAAHARRRQRDAA